MTEPPDTHVELSLAESWREAVACHQSGNIARAESLYRSVIRRESGHAPAHHHLGVLLRQNGRYQEALSHLKIALESVPAMRQHWLSYIVTLGEAGLPDAGAQVLAQARSFGLTGTDVDQAEKRLRELAGLSRDNKHPLPLVTDIRLMNELADRGEYEKLKRLSQKTTQNYPAFTFAWKMLGFSLHRLGELAGALAAYQKADDIQPGDTETISSIATVMQLLGRLDEAELTYRRAIEIAPRNALTHFNLGTALAMLGRQIDALTAYLKAAKLEPGNAKVYYNIGNLLRDAGDIPETMQSQVIQLTQRPARDAKAGAGIANYKKVGQSLAELAYRRALQINPDYPECLNNLGFLLTCRGRIAEAELALCNALKLDPGYRVAYSNYLYLLNYHPDKTAEEIYSAYAEYDRRFGRPLGLLSQAYDNLRDMNRRLRVAYVSADFNLHSMSRFFEPLLAHHDKDKFEIYAYAEMTRPEDAMTGKYRGYVDHWRMTRGLPADKIATQIRQDAIDILVDLAGHSAGNRLDVFALKPAPVSVSWLGFGYTTGLTAIDYFLTDTHVVPAASDSLFSEKPWRMAYPFAVYRASADMGPVSLLPAVSSGRITFGTLTRAVRINQRCIRTWAAILRAIPNSRLVIDSRDFREPAMCVETKERFGAQGISTDRLQLGFHSPPWEVLRNIDIGLDCFPHNSGTTLYETLYMGIPYITLSDRPSVGRLGGSILKAIGHEEWIAESEAEYIDKATHLASDMENLAKLRADLRETMEQSSLMDEPRFARKVEQAYTEMFACWAGLPTPWLTA
jgi:predicted O-linked N-acetylglucosamine transferase (SPINDLY family)